MNIMSTEYRNDITPEYVQENIDEIIEVMSSMLPSSAQQPANWRRALKNEDPHKNITYVGYIILHKDLKRQQSFGKRVEALYDKEELLEERIERETSLSDKRNKQHKDWRNVFKIVNDELREQMDNVDHRDYDNWVSNNLSEYSSGFYGF